MEEEVKEDKVEDVYTVSYFPLYARGEPVRVALELAKLKWVDKVC